MRTATIVSWSRLTKRATGGPAGGGGAAGVAGQALGDGLDVVRGGITVDKLHRVRKEASASHSPGRISGSMMSGTSAGGIGTLPAMFKTVTRGNAMSARAADDNR